MSAFFGIPTAARLLPPGAFEAAVSRVGQRVAWMKSHACPCVFAPSAPTARLSTPGSPQKPCQTCFGMGIYWDAPGLPFIGAISFMHMSPSPDEPGTVVNEKFGTFLSAEPSLTIPHQNPNLAAGDPAQPTTAWTNASTEDIFVAVDMLSRYCAILQVGGLMNLPFQQNLQVAPSGAVTVWNAATMQVQPVALYSVSGPTVEINGYPTGTYYMVEFQAAALYVAFRRAGGLAHIRPLGGGTLNEPRRFRLQTLDFWTRQRGIQPPAAGTVFAGGTSMPYIPALGFAKAA